MGSKGGEIMKDGMNQSMGGNDGGREEMINQQRSGDKDDQ
jgi:hypothetical protein